VLACRLRAVSWGSILLRDDQEVVHPGGLWIIFVMCATNLDPLDVTILEDCVSKPEDHPEAGLKKMNRAEWQQLNIRAKQG